MSDIEVDQLRLSFGAHPIERSSNITLEDCDLFNNATITVLVMCN